MARDPAQPVRSKPGDRGSIRYWYAGAGWLGRSELRSTSHCVPGWDLVKLRLRSPELGRSGTQ